MTLMFEDNYGRLPRAGDYEKGSRTEFFYISPKPLPTGVVAFSSQQSYKSINSVFLDYSSGVKGLELAVRVLVGSMVGVAILFAALNIFISIYSYMYGYFFWIELFKNIVNPYMWLVFFFLLMVTVFPLYRHIQKINNHPPVRFNRQRREVAYVPKKGQPPLIVPWEEVIACVTVGSVVTEYAVMPSASLMIGLRDSSSGAVAWLTIPTGHLSLAVSEWEALRVYMEEGPEAVPVTLLTDEEFQEGTVAYFHMCREVYREMHAWPVYAFGFLTIQFCSGWTLPCRLAQWVSNQPKAAFPDSIVEWSKPIPAEQHAQPSPELLQQSAEVREAFSQGLSLLEFYNIKFSQDKASPDNELGQ